MISLDRDVSLDKTICTSIPECRSCKAMSGYRAWRNMGIMYALCFLNLFQ